MSNKVVLHLYDLSQGMAKQLSMGFIGKQIEGIWHTGIVVYGKEFYFGGGICSDPVGQTPYGFPLQRIDVGETDIPEELFMEFLKEVKHKFTIDTYDLFKNNCNNFTDACCEFLTGKGIPSYITGLPEEVLATPFGQMMKPLIDGFTNTLNQNSHPIPQMFEGNSNASQMFAAPSIATNNVISSNTPATGNVIKSQGAVEQVNSIEDFFGVLDSYPAVIVDFFSYTCPPCIRIKPIFEKLAREYADKCPKLKFVSVNTQTAYEISSQFEITAIPTFIGYYDAMQVERFSGADQNKIEKLISTLIKKVDPSYNVETVQQKPVNPQPVKKEFLTFNPQKKIYLSFEGDAYALAINTIKSTLDKYPALKQSESRVAFDVFAKDPQNNAKTFPNEERASLVNWTLDCISVIGVNDKSIGFLDLLKMLTVDETYACLTSKNPLFNDIALFFDLSDADIKEVPKGLRLVLLRLITNVTAHESTKDYFQANLSRFLKQITNAGRLYKDEKTPLYAVTMILWNVSQSLYKTKELEETKEIILNFAHEAFNGSSDNDIFYTCALIFCLLSHENIKIKKSIKESIDQSKISKVTSGAESNAKKAIQDLTSIINN